MYLGRYNWGSGHPRAGKLAWDRVAHLRAEKAGAFIPLTSLYHWLPGRDGGSRPQLAMYEAMLESCWVGLQEIFMENLPVDKYWQRISTSFK